VKVVQAAADAVPFGEHGLNAFVAITSTGLTVEDRRLKWPG